MFRINALFEAWLREATEKPLASWKRTALLWRLQESEELRCYAAELAEFSFETEQAAPKSFGEEQQAWMRQRMQARLKDVGKGTLSDGNAWVTPALGLALGLALLALVLNAPPKDSGNGAQAANAEQGAALTLPSPTPTMTTTPTASVTPNSEAAFAPGTPVALTPAP
jgi:hypothetical protein